MSGEKTEQPTAKKRRDLREQGQVAQSKEVPSAALMLAFFGLFVATAGTMVDRFKALILMPLPLLQADFTTSVEDLLRAYMDAMLLALAPFLGVVVVVGVASYVFQTGLMFSMQSIAPSLKKLNPAEYVKKTFGAQNFVEFGKSIVKILVLGLVLTFVIRDGMQAMVLLPTCGISCFSGVTGSLLIDVILWSAGPFILVGAFDFAFQRWSFTKRNMMSKDEVKREYKESEGDPLIKGKRKQLHQQMLSEGMVDRARKASVLIVNPTHIAVAITYRHGETPLPVVSGMGTDLVASRMIAAAVAADVPVMRDVPLAHSLLETGLLDQYIPSELIEPLAEILRALGKLAADVGAGAR